MTRIELLCSFVSLLLYLTQIGWLLYGNYIYFNMPSELTDMSKLPSLSETGANLETGELTGE